MISPLLSTLLTCTNSLVYLCILGIPLRLLIYLENIFTIMTSQECHFSSLALQRGRENEAVVTLNRGRDMPQLGLRKSQARGHPKAQPPLSSGGCGDQSHLCPRCSTDDISLDNLQVQQGFSHIQGEFCCPASSGPFAGQLCFPLFPISFLQTFLALPSFPLPCSGRDAEC